MIPYNQRAVEQALAKLQADPTRLTDADIAHLDAIGKGDAALVARQVALLAKVPPDAPVVTKSAAAPPTRRDDAIAALIVSTVKRATVADRERLANAETEIKALRDRVVDLEARIAVRDGTDRVGR